MLSIAALKFVSSNYDFIKCNKDAGKSWDEVSSALKKRTGSSLPIQDLATCYKLIAVGDELKQKYNTDSKKG